MIDKIQFYGAYGEESSVSLTPKIFNFPAGESHVSLNDCSEVSFQLAMAESCSIVFRVNNAEDLLQLVMLTDIIKNSSSMPINVFIPYWPAARQDRRNGYESLGTKVYADIINAQKYSSVTILDAHSDVTPALINKCINASPIKYIKQAIKDFSPDVLIAPDAGASKKMASYNLDLPIVFCSKQRDIETGKLNNFKVHTDSKYSRALICDDIIDGGGSFLGLEPFIRDSMEVDKLGIYCTHGIFSKGEDIITDVFEKVYCTNSYKADYGNQVNVFKAT